jgi:hypothetical protein
VPKDLQQTVVEKLPAAAEYTVGDPADEATRIGPLASETQRGRVDDYIRRGIADGATLVVGGPGRPEGFETGAYVKPTIFSDVDPRSVIAQEEIFGPVRRSTYIRTPPRVQDTRTDGTRRSDRMQVSAEIVSHAGRCWTVAGMPAYLDGAEASACIVRGGASAGASERAWWLARAGTRGPLVGSMVGSTPCRPSNAPAGLRKAFRLSAAARSQQRDGSWRPVVGAHPPRMGCSHQIVLPCRLWRPRSPRRHGDGAR